MSGTFTLEDLGDLLADGAALFNAGDYWEAHEAWEEAWHVLRREDRDEAAELVQGYILATAALENLRRGKRAGFAVQLAKALKRMRAHGDQARRLGIAEPDGFREAMTDLYLAVMSDSSVRDLGGLSRLVPELRLRPQS